MCFFPGELAALLPLLVWSYLFDTANVIRLPILARERSHFVIRLVVSPGNGRRALEDLSSLMHISME